METEEFAIMLIVGIAAFFGGAMIHEFASDHLAREFCDHQGHVGLDRSDAQLPQPYVVCYDYDTKGQQDMTYTEYRFAVFGPKTIQR